MLLRNVYLLLVGFVLSTTSADVVEFTPATLKAALDAPASEHKHVFVEFYAPWCGHCKELEPKYNYVGGKVDPKSHGIMVGKIDADKFGTELSEFGVQGFPTVKLFKWSGEKRSPITFESAREPKHMLSFLNKHCATSLTADDWTPPKREKSRGGREMNDLYTAFDLMNALKYDEARSKLESVANKDDRSGKAAQKVLEKLECIGAEISGLDVDQWLQVDQDTYAPPDIASEEHKDTLFLVARLDFRSASRGALEPMLEDARAAGAYIIRLTGAYTDIDDDITYPVAQAEDRPNILLPAEGADAATKRRLGNVLSNMQDAILIKDKKLIWSAHVGIVDDTLVSTIKSMTKKPSGHEEL